MSEELKQRAEFENALGKGYDYTKEPDAWARPKYKQTHIEAMFNGWQLARHAIHEVEKHYDRTTAKDLIAEQYKAIGQVNIPKDLAGTSAVELVSDNEVLQALLPAVWTDKNVAQFNEALQRLKRAGYIVVKAEQWLKKVGA